MELLAWKTQKWTEHAKTRTAVRTYSGRFTEAGRALEICEKVLWFEAKVLTLRHRRDTLLPCR